MQLLQFWLDSIAVIQLLKFRSLSIDKSTDVLLGLCSALTLVVRLETMLRISMNFRDDRRQMIEGKPKFETPPKEWTT
jgi:hypothetical protein